nr:MAG TPA: hypothetical protein [Caudoviricetes sp.]
MILSSSSSYTFFNFYIVRRVKIGPSPFSGSMSSSSNGPFSLIKISSI